MTIKFYNTNEAFGYCGPFEAESKEALADEMESLFNSWTNPVQYPENTQTVEEMRAEFIAGLEAQYHGEPRIVFDNGGGITLQLPGFAHNYDSADQCAADIKEWLETDSTDGWDGNEEESVFETTMDDIQSGGYLEMSVDEILGMRLREAEAHSWENVQRIFAALTCALLD